MSAEQYEAMEFIVVWKRDGVYPDRREFPSEEQAMVWYDSLVEEGAVDPEVYAKRINIIRWRIK